VLRFTVTVMPREFVSKDGRIAEMLTKRLRSTPRRNPAC